MTKQNKTTGIKAAAGLTKQILPNQEYVQVTYDPEENHIYAVKHLNNNWSVYHDDNMLHVANYYSAATMKEIEADLQAAINNQ